MWRESVTKTVSNNQIQIDDSISLTIPFRDGYLPPKKYVKLPNDEMKDYWTLNSKNNLDIIVLGEVKEDITESYSIHDLKEDYDNVATISAVSDNTLVDKLKHWKVSAK